MKVVQLQTENPVVIEERARDGTSADLGTEIPMQSASRDIWDKKYRLKSKTGETLDQDIAGDRKSVV